MLSSAGDVTLSKTGGRGINAPRTAMWRGPVPFGCAMSSWIL
jgi:hypothetical protein